MFRERIVSVYVRKKILFVYQILSMVSWLEC